jgi:hypothetical protein
MIEDMGLKLSHRVPLNGISFLSHFMKIYKNGSKVISGGHTQTDRQTERLVI